MSRPVAPQWLVVLERDLRRAGLPVHELVSGSGRLTVSLRDRDAGDLAAYVEPRDSGREGWAATRRFVLGYDGPQQLAAAGSSFMQGLLRVVRRLEPHLPPTLDEPCGVFAPETEPEARFLRLFPFCTVERSSVGERATTEVLVRTTARCNQVCPFCSGPPPHPEPSAATVGACIDDAAATFPEAVLTLTGGEPTLRSTFEDEVRRAIRHAAFSQVLVQTNAVAFAKRLDARALGPSERLCFFVSLHALDEALYDRCTGTRRQLERAIAGVRALLEARHRMIINCVVSRTNVAHLPEYVRALPTVLPDPTAVELHFSVLICPEHRPEAPDLLVPYTELAPALEGATRDAREAGLRVSPLRSSTHASLPTCVIGPEYRSDAARRPELRAGESGFEDFSKAWIKATRCRSCIEQARCLGVPRAYAERLGLDELRPIPGD